MPWGFLKSAANSLVGVFEGVTGVDIPYLGPAGGPTTRLADPMAGQALFPVNPGSPADAMAMAREGALNIQQAGMGKLVPVAARAALKTAIQGARAAGVTRMGIRGWIYRNPTLANILGIAGISAVIDVLIDEVYGPEGGTMNGSGAIVPAALLAEPMVGARQTCPRGYVLVTLQNGAKTCMLREYAIKHKFYRPRRKPPISASDMRRLKDAKRTARKLCRIAEDAIDLDKQVRPRRRRKTTKC